MEVTIVKEEKNELELEIDNQTVIEILRVYLNKDSNVKLAAWQKPHYSKPLLLRIVTEGKSAKKALDDAIGALQKDLKMYSSEFAKAK